MSPTGNGAATDNQSQAQHSSPESPAILGSRSVNAYNCITRHRHDNATDMHGRAMYIGMKSGVFWDVTPCGYCMNRRFGSASFIRVTRIGELETTLAVTSNRRTLRRSAPAASAIKAGGLACWGQWEFAAETHLNCSACKTGFYALLEIFQGAHRSAIYMWLSKFRTFMIS
jgi:hypothetical protein